MSEKIVKSIYKANCEPMPITLDYSGNRASLTIHAGYNSPDAIIRAIVDTISDAYTDHGLYPQNVTIIYPLNVKY